MSYTAIAGANTFYCTGNADPLTADPYFEAHIDAVNTDGTVNVHEYTSGAVHLNVPVHQSADPSPYTPFITDTVTLWPTHVANFPQSTVPRRR